ncbi:MAG: aminotransferase class IV [Planctomycetota bacterium]|jgi:branched-chain amino acid aminotransferase
MRIDSLAWCDGRVLPVAEAAVSVLDRTLLYGLGAFETVRLHGGRPFLLERHVERMRRSLDAIRLPAPASLSELTSGVPELSARLDSPSALCRITVTAGPEPVPGADPAEGMRVIALLRPAPAVEAGGVTVALAPFVHDPSSPIAGVKTTSYLTHYLQRDIAERAGRLDDLMVDGAGCVTEGTVSNVFGVRDGRLITPPLASGILPGVTRGVVLELAAELGIPVDERVLPADELEHLEECFLTGAGKCLVIVDVLVGRTMSVARPISSTLRDALKARIASTCGVDVSTILF